MNEVVAGRIMAGIFGFSALLCLLASVLNWEWFFRSQGVRMLVWKLPRVWQRIVYGLLALLMIYAAYTIISTPAGVKNP